MPIMLTRDLMKQRDQLFFAVSVALSNFLLALVAH
jgi:hypothetical protein